MTDIQDNRITPIKRHPSGENYVGQRINISCSIVLSNKNDNITVNSSIISAEGNIIPHGNKGDRRIIHGLMETSSGYESVLEFFPLSEADRGSYTCTWLVTKTTPVLYSYNFDINLQRELFNNGCCAYIIGKPIS